jgi:hypothetical protein
MNKLERKLINTKHRNKMLWCGFTTQDTAKRQNNVKTDSYRTKALQRDNLKLEKDGWK